MANFDEAVEILLEIEGGLVDSPHDKGGITKYGISLRFLKSIDPTTTKKDIKNLTPEQARQIYKHHFWDKNRYGEIQWQDIAEKVFILCVHSGQSRANKVLQRAICDACCVVEVDGLIGDKTIYALNNDCDCRLVGVYFDLQTIDYYRRLVNHDRSQEPNLLGWLNRVFT